ncbi:MAG TPA: hypothetical protein VER55_00765, partial [Ardenticatenaceae bacterium]|nr:hypothetical protein [Ardenticatenaceae bacterium]
MSATLKSLLWPVGPPGVIPNSAWAADLDLPTLAAELDFDRRHARQIHDLLIALVEDLPTIRHRQDVLRDLLTSAGIATRLERLLPAHGTLATTARPGWTADETPLLAVARRIGELDLYVTTVTELISALEGHELASEGLRTLRSDLQAIAADPIFARLVVELPALKEPLERLASVTVGINLDSDLRPTGATLVAINDFRFGGPQGLLGRLLGEGAAPGITPLRTVDPRAPDPFAAQLFRDLGRLLSGVTESLAKGLERYRRMTAAPLGALQAELAFFLGAVRLVRRLEAAGLPCVFPELLPADRRRTRLDGFYDLSLALRVPERASSSLVLNDVRLDEHGRIAIVTGPNRGGKTTFTRGIGLAHVMAQAGLPVPARQASLSPSQGIFTEFASGETTTVGHGRFDEEARRLAMIFEHATPSSLVLLNEPLSGTSPDEALQIARGVVTGLQQLGARTIVVTHLHALAGDAALLSAAIPESPVVSLVASPANGSVNDDGVQRSFRVVPGPPAGESRALEIARHHGLTGEQVSARLRARGLLGPDA